MYTLNTTLELKILYAFNYSVAARDIGALKLAKRGTYGNKWLNTFSPMSKWEQTLKNVIFNHRQTYEPLQFYIKETEAAQPHPDNNDASLGDDVLGQVVEDGVRVVIKGLQLLHPVVQLDVRSHVLVEGAVHCWRSELDHRVIFLMGLLNGRRFRITHPKWLMGHR